MPSCVGFDVFCVLKVCFRLSRCSIFFAFNRKHFWSFGCLCCFIHSLLSTESDFVWTCSFVWRKRFFVNVGCLCACLCFDLDISFVFFALNPLKRFRLDFFFFCARESILVYFWCLRCFIHFLRFSPPKAISWDFSFFCVGGCLCACLCFDLDISFIFFALNPLKRFRLDFFFFCARESILVYFWCLRCFILFSSLFPS